MLFRSGRFQAAHRACFSGRNVLWSFCDRSDQGSGNRPYDDVSGFRFAAQDQRCLASFTIARSKNNPEDVAVSARSDGSYNVQKIMEKMNGGGHFTAAALERKNTTVEAVKEELLGYLKEDAKSEGYIAEGR